MSETRPIVPILLDQVVEKSFLAGDHQWSCIRDTQTAFKLQESSISADPVYIQAGGCVEEGFKFIRRV